MFDPIEAKVIAVVRRITKRTDEPITLDLTFEALGLDSLDALNVVFDLEDEFNIAFPNEEAVKIKDVRTAVATLKQFLARTARSSEMRVVIPRLQ